MSVLALLLDSDNPIFKNIMLCLFVWLLDFKSPKIVVTWSKSKHRSWFFLREVLLQSKLSAKFHCSSIFIYYLITKIAINWSKSAPKSWTFLCKVLVPPEVPAKCERSSKTCDPSLYVYLYVPPPQKKFFFCISTSFRIDQDIWSLPDAGFVESFLFLFSLQFGLRSFTTV